MNKSLDIIGYGGHSKVILDLAKHHNYSLFKFHVNNYIEEGDIKDNVYIGLRYEDLKNDTLIAIGNNATRKKISIDLNFCRFVSLIHPTAIIAENVKIGYGSVIMAGAIIQSGSKIGHHCIINTGACVDHDVVISDYVHIAPNCSIAGSVFIDEGTFIGIGSTVINNISIGSWSTIGAGSVIIQNLISNITAVGNPAKIIKYL